ncbi:hypothetical protein CU669_05025 [Paramagnetospirillum kuznetsovii]|uniref:histidine kinase n=1 Tax=Paramagnetospirillum kuznetsovii TaxID=2053833 RepID=A0A364P0A4_9PROT|nr:hybrid sensor histidine kinase/response regulator [Paramagnetospirillum kuznetsovii]RAU22754.1 hypothetical protein CU669_05025 [Paramagnetospirillum kuznetsovii]
MTEKPLRVLLVEDSPDDAELVEIELLKGGFAPMIHRVETAEQMVAALAADDWDVVLSDFNLPAFSAGGALDALQASGKDLPFLILSGLVRVEDAIALMKRGAHDFLDKAALARLVPAIEREIRDASERAQRRQAVEYLTRANTELERFAYVASHDLQEPLRTLTSFTQLLERRGGERMDADCREYMSFIIGAAKRMHELINDLLTYTRVSSRQHTTSIVPLAEACKAALSNLKSTIDEAGAMITVGELPKIVGDPVQMMQLFQNLIGNAVKFRRPDVTPTISISSERVEGDWVVAVRDNGIGIAPSTHDIFEIFRRLHNQSEYAGTGVGLAICKCILQSHHGRIWVESMPGEGSAFFFAIPALA